MGKRRLELCVLSDLHLGTYGCHARELMEYLDSIDPGILILNGDIIDAWNFNKKFFPVSHIAIVQKILHFAKTGTEVYYLAGNHDEFLRRHVPLHLESLHLENKLVLEVNGERVWFFHGDVFDASIQCSRWLAKLGGKGYDWLIRINHLINRVLMKMNRPKMSLSQKVKDGVKRAAKFISDFEQIAGEHAIDHCYDRVICGHIHQPQMREISNENGRVVYMNSGDWIENLTALEYHSGRWSIYYHEKDYDPLGSSKELTDEGINLKVKNTAIDLEAVLTAQFVRHGL